MSTPQATGSPSEPIDYKAQLDDLATKPRQPPQSTEGQEDNNKPEGTGAVIVDKVSQIIPAVKKVLGRGGDEAQQQRDTAPDKPPSGPPDRPAHDPHIAEFLRDQHKSIEITSVEE
ncbi:hypothetical protein B0T18DRAFT_426597 [Schizothecium vesticola]|uniref:Uncharacterized protein n=1 Tax=Schizothecium vesticola TaxID=314040 RepID=A0AA40F6G2_9PEZI|nr:hypothetical protein B0T18DRAFT_426597 [Schizothecium vesticola]